LVEIVDFLKNPKKFADMGECRRSEQ
jgi:ATP-dependent Zn protease